jgi:hypothetical protein
MIANVVHEWRTMPWTPRGRRVGRVIEGTFVFVLLMFGPCLTVALVNWLVP